MELKKKGIHLTFLRIFSFKQPKGVIGLAEEEENTHTHTHTHTPHITEVYRKRRTSHSHDAASCFPFSDSNYT